MIEIAEVFRRFAADYLSAHGASMLPSHRRAIEDILACRTAALGGQVWRCEACSTEVFSYHSCGNRSCPKCHTAQTRAWLERRQAELLPVPYFHITITVPAELRALLRANQRDGYGVLMQACAAAIIELAHDPRYVGGTVAVLAVLHTWTQQLSFHPHVHCLVSGGGISEDASTWHLTRRKFLVPIKALAKLVRGKFRAMLRRKCPDLAIPDAVSARAVGLHPRAHAALTAPGHGAMIDNVSLRRHRPVLPLRASARHGDPLSVTQPVAPTLLQMTLPIVLKEPLPTAIQPSCNADQAGRAAIISPGSERPW